MSRGLEAVARVRAARATGALGQEQTSGVQGGVERYAHGTSRGVRTAECANSWKLCDPFPSVNEDGVGRSQV